MKTALAGCTECKNFMTVVRQSIGAGSLLRRKNLWRPVSLLLILFGLLNGCAVAPPMPTPVKREPWALNLQHSTTVRRQLYRQWKAWKGVGYRYGGLSKRGVDCSGFVYLTFRDRLGFILPRTTDAQLGVGRTVAKDDLQPGDLVFFKTGFEQLHVGIYAGGGRFLHVSTEDGVRYSWLRNTYWSDHYLTARRLTSHALVANP